MTSVHRRYDYVDAIMRFERGEATDDEVIEMAQFMVDTGMAWTLQGMYGRLCARLIEEGLVTPVQKGEGK